MKFVMSFLGSDFVEIDLSDLNEASNTTAIMQMLASEKTPEWIDRTFVEVTFLN